MKRFAMSMKLVITFANFHVRPTYCVVKIKIQWVVQSRWARKTACVCSSYRRMMQTTYDHYLKDHETTLLFSNKEAGSNTATSRRWFHDVFMSHIRKNTSNNVGLIDYKTSSHNELKDTRGQIVVFPLPAM